MAPARAIRGDPRRGGTSTTLLSDSAPCGTVVPNAEEAERTLAQEVHDDLRFDDLVEFVAPGSQIGKVFPGFAKELDGPLPGLP